MMRATQPPRLTIELAGETHALVLREAQTCEILPLVLDPDARTERRAKRRLALELMSLVDTIDGELPSEAQAEAIVASPQALATVCQARNAFYDALVEGGRALAICPHCQQGEVALDLLFYWMALRLPPYRFFDDGVLLGHPALADPLPAGSRPPARPLAEAIECSYPAEPELRARLRSLHAGDVPAREAAAWQRCLARAVQAGDDDDAVWHWSRENTGFRGILRLSLGLTWKDGRAADPEEIDRLPIGAYLFLDLLHFATTNCDVADPDRLGVVCPRCGGSFLPVLATG